MKTSELAKMQLIIFDCDGVLVDSESIANPLFYKMLTEYGINISYEESYTSFTGLSVRTCLSLIEKKFGKVLPKNLTDEYQENVMLALKTDLKPIKGIHSALENIKQPICVASGSSHERIRLSLELTGLLSKFEGNIFSASDVTRGKPAPDLFLHAAQKMGFLPEQCTVIEDSVPGVQAGVAAGMTVLGYACGHKPEDLASAGAHFVFDDMHLLPELLKSYSRQSDMEIA